MDGLVRDGLADGERQLEVLFRRAEGQGREIEGPLREPLMFPGDVVVHDDDVEAVRRRRHEAEGRVVVVLFEDGGLGVYPDLGPGHDAGAAAHLDVGIYQPRRDVGRRQGRPEALHFDLHEARRELRGTRREEGRFQRHQRLRRRRRFLGGGGVLVPCCCCCLQKVGLGGILREAEFDDDVALEDKFEADGDGGPKDLGRAQAPGDVAADAHGLSFRETALELPGDLRDLRHHLLPPRRRLRRVQQAPDQRVRRHRRRKGRHVVRVQQVHEPRLQLQRVRRHRKRHRLLRLRRPHHLLLRRRRLSRHDLRSTMTFLTKNELHNFRRDATFHAP
mmetsp:Transcript_19505/g.62676  ORF Transcript_19505/g.62676 Transcript_19505/m.62676 type:complete len:333 (+) Transcript_19505:290-1288(+)